MLSALLLAGCSHTSSSETAATDAFRSRQSNVQVSGSGVVDRILEDDNSGLPHQRFIVRLADGQTILIEHNTDVAPRIDDLRIGDDVSFTGEYIWNERGGLVHWTHRDPAGKHPGGWIVHKGRRFE